jgi:hypothetical protein
MTTMRASATRTGACLASQPAAMVQARRPVAPQDRRGSFQVALKLIGIRVLTFGLGCA